MSETMTDEAREKRRKELVARANRKGPALAELDRLDAREERIEEEARTRAAEIDGDLADLRQEIAVANVDAAIERQNRSRS